MSDNVLYQPPGGGSPISIAGDSVGNVLYQRIKFTFGVDGTAVDVSETNPLPVNAVGELVEAIEALRFAVAALTRSVGMALPGAAGWPIMEVRQATAGNLNMTASIASGQTIATVSTLTNQAQAGGFALNDQLPATMHMQCDGLRANITVT
ncbi:MAG: hypothetical protein IOC87_02820 [Rhodobacter sp.]|nr:hypothetical protein [Rhodobacter sp.]